MSIRWRILIAFISIILLTFLLNFGVGYWSIQQNSQHFAAEHGTTEANLLSTIISQKYTEAGEWPDLEPILFEFIYNKLANELEEPSFITPISKADFESRKLEVALSQVLFNRILIVDIDNTILLDTSSSGSLFRSREPFPMSRASPILDLNTGQTVGFIMVEIPSAVHGSDEPVMLLEIVFIGGLLTAIIAMILALWFANRITSPITALINATRAIAQQEETELLPVNFSGELGQMSRAFNEMTLAMRTQRNLRKRLINDVSHEISTPLSVIQLEAKGLKDGLQSPEKAADLIIQEVGLLRNLVHDLNWLAETDSAEMRLNLESYSLKNLLSAEVGRWQNQAVSKKIDLTLAAFPTLPEIILDPVRMSQVLGNLLKNAIQHTPEGESISVSTGHFSDSAQTGGQIAINVTDTGAGIHESDLPHLFERFYRADESRNRSSGGSGLGLAIAKAIVEAHGGEIAITSAGIGKGTTVKVELPIDSTFAQTQLQE